MKRINDLDVIHQLPLAGAFAANQFFERDVIQDTADCTVDLDPDRLKLSGVHRRHLHERSADGTDHVSNGDLTRRATQRVSAFHSAAASDDVNTLQNLHDLKKKLHRDLPPLSNVLNPHR